MKNITKKELFETVINIMEHYCEGCFINKQLKKEEGRRVAHRFCITKCTIGEKLKEYGKKLT